MTTKKTLQIKQVKSGISSTKRQKETLRSLGLRKLNQIVEQVDNPAIRGMIAKVSHLITVEEVEA
jgi:large subunit ribosomal protein L30